MRRTTIPLPLIGLIAVTRGMLGAGLGLLLADRLTPRQKKAAGWTLFLAGAVSTVPLAARVLGEARDQVSEADREGAQNNSVGRIGGGPA